MPTPTTVGVMSCAFRSFVQIFSRIDFQLGLELALKPEMFPRFPTQAQKHVARLVRGSRGVAKSFFSGVLRKFVLL